MRFITAVILAAVVTGALLTSCSQKAPESDAPSSQPPVSVSEPGGGQNSPATTATPSPVTPEPEPASAPSGSFVYLDNANLQFSDLTGTVFVFTSGVGAWSSEFEVYPDGTFKGSYADVNMGETGPEYPNGTMYICAYSGKFSELKRTGDYTYSLKSETLTQEGTPGEEVIIDGQRYVTSEPHGFDNADEFILYLPGKKIAELPEDFIMWMQWRVDDESTDVMSFYGLYNVGGAQGFCGY
jgi:hypothetical protein